MHHRQHVHERSPVTEGLFQIGVGLPVYVVTTRLALGFVRVGARAARRRAVPAHRVEATVPA